MTDRRFPVTFVPAGVTVWAEEGTTLLECARSASILIPAPCGGRGVCGKCGVKILEGAPSPPDAIEARGLGVAPPGVRLSCLMRVEGPLTVKPIISAAIPSSDTAEDTQDESVLAAVDLGTTTVEAVVLGERSGRELGRAVLPNEQQSFGADVVSRIAAAQQGHLEELRDAAERSVIAALHAACGRAGACLAAVTRLVISGNSVMAASLLGKSLEGFEAHPFRSPITEPTPLRNGSAVVDSLPVGSTTVVLPPVASFVGGDVLSGLLSAGLLEKDQVAVYVDAGTNAEIVIVARGRFHVASAAAGPALEGSGITSGGPAAPGGIRRVAISDEGTLSLDVIGSGAPQWLTGSGLVSAVAALMRAGHVDSDGALHADGPLAERVERVEGVLAVRLSEGVGTQVYLSQTDIRSLQTAKGALAAGILAAMRAARVKPRGVQRLVLAGGLGSALDPADLALLGVVPSELIGSAEYVGNASLIGAAMMAASPELIGRATSALEGAIHVELASDAGFTAAFLDALALEPYTSKQGFARKAR